MKILKVALASAVLASVALCANAKEPSVQAKEVADKHFKLNKEATALQLKINEICRQKGLIMYEATRDLTPEQVPLFHEELKYQNRQNLAKLKRGEDYIEGICRMPIRPKAKVGPKGAGYGPGACAAGNCPLARP